MAGFINQMKNDKCSKNIFSELNKCSANISLFEHIHYVLHARFTEAPVPKINLYLKK